MMHRGLNRTAVALLAMGMVGLVGIDRIFADKTQAGADRVTLQLTITDSDTGLEVKANKTFDKGTSGFDALRSIVTLTYKSYPKLGALITSLCEVEPKSGKAWFLYVDGKKSEVGISSVVLANDMTMEWKTE